MKKILYLSNIEVPYRVRFFNELAKHCRLTVLYESRSCQHRDPRWAKSEEKKFRAEYLTESLLSVLQESYDTVILGCYHTPMQIFAAALLRLRNIPYVINLDGEPYLDGNGMKARCKRLLLDGGAAYLTAGERAARSLQDLAANRCVTPYYFSSLSGQEARRELPREKRTDTILVVGQYLPYKGLDVALEAARMDKTLHYRFVGMGARTEKMKRENRIPENVELVPFLSREALEREYMRCALLVLPSRRECWGLVINEAASFGTPVVSTWGSGAAVEFLSEKYPQYLAEPGDAADLLCCIRRCLAAEDNEAYGAFLREKGLRYNLEHSVRIHMEALEGELL